MPSARLLKPELSGHLDCPLHTQTYAQGTLQLQRPRPPQPVRPSQAHTESQQPEGGFRDESGRVSPLLQTVPWPRVIQSQGKNFTVADKVVAWPHTLAVLLAQPHSLHCIPGPSCRP